MDINTVTIIVYIICMLFFMQTLRKQHKIIKAYREMLQKDMELLENITDGLKQEIKKQEIKRFKKVSKEELN